MEEVRRKESRQNVGAKQQLERNQLVVAQESRILDGCRSRALGAIERQTVGDGTAYAMRLELQKEYASGTIGQARSRFNPGRLGTERSGSLTSGLLEPMRKAAEMVERHLEGIFGPLEAGADHCGSLKDLTVVSATKRKARGYRSTEYQIAMLYFVAGKLQVPYYG